MARTPLPHDEAPKRSSELLRARLRFAAETQYQADLEATPWDALLASLPQAKQAEVRQCADELASFKRESRAEAVQRMRLLPKDSPGRLTLDEWLALPEELAPEDASWIREYLTDRLAAEQEFFPGEYSPLRLLPQEWLQFINNR